MCLHVKNVVPAERAGDFYGECSWLWFKTGLSQKANLELQIDQRAAGTSGTDLFSGEFTVEGNLVILQGYLVNLL